MNNKQLKRLAEKHFYLGRKLTPEESFLLENSKYKSIVKKESKFSKMLEQYSFGEQEQPFKVKYTKRRRMSIPGIDKSIVRDLVDDIEDKFNIGIENSSPAKYDSVNVDEVKQFIQQYADKNLFDGNMLREVKDVMDSETVYDILHKLYTLEM
jgi:hypothetical protein